MQASHALTTRPSGILVLPVLIFLTAFYLLPAFLVLLMSAGHPPSFSIRTDLLSAANYERLFNSGYYLKVLVRTVTLGFVVGIVAAVFGYPVAYFLVRSKSRFRPLIYVLTLIPDGCRHEHDHAGLAGGAWPSRVHQLVSTADWRH